MSYKRGTYISLLVLITLAIWLIKIASGWKTAIKTSSIGPNYFPVGLLVLLIILCIISGVQTWRNNEDRTIDFPNLKMILITCGLLILFLLSWQVSGYFYICLFLYLMISLIIYQPKDHILKRLSLNLIVTAMVMVFVYLIFDRIMKLPF